MSKAFTAALLTAAIAFNPPSALAAPYSADDIALTESGSLTAADGGEEPERGAAQTVFIYMIGSDMPLLAERDICEMLRSGYDSADTNVILFAGDGEWGLDALNAAPLNVFRLTGNGLIRIEDDTEYNMFDTDDIYDLMFRYMSRYRAEKYSVFFWDHGGGFANGFGKDATGGNPAISVTELAGVFADIKEDIKSDYGIDYNYETVGFDACLMADIQTENEFAKAGFKYFIGSEAVENSLGWDYGFLSVLNDNPSVSGDELCRVIIDRSAEACAETVASPSYSTACTDLSLTGNVIDALNITAQLIPPDKITDAAAARTDSLSFGTGNYYTDIYDYAQNLNAHGISGDGLKAAAASAVIYSRADDERAHGISVYGYYYGNESTLEKWCALTDSRLADYKNLQLMIRYEANVDDAEPSAAGGSVIRDGSRYSFNIDEAAAKDTYGARLCVYKRENGLLRRIASVRDTHIAGNTVYADFDGTAIRLISGSTAYECDSDTENGQVRVRLAKDTGSIAAAADFREMELSLDGDCNIIGTRYINTGALAAKDDSSFGTGDRVYIPALCLNDDDTPAEPVPDIFIAHNPRFERAVITGEYLCRFELINAYGYAQNYSPLITVNGGVTDAVSAPITRYDAKDLKITAKDEAIEVPCGYDELISRGYIPDAAPVTLGSSASAYATLHKGDNYIDITVTNFDGNSRQSDQCTVTAVSVTDGTCAGFATATAPDPAGADAVYTTRDSVKYLYGIDDGCIMPYISGSLGLNGMFLNTPRNYVAVETDRGSGIIRRLTLNSRSGCEVTRSDPVKYKADYFAPAELGYNPYSFNISMDGSVYSLPVPVSVLSADGWTYECGVSQIGSLNSAEAVFTRNGKRFIADMVNYSDSEAETDDCMVCGVYLSFADSPDTVLPGGINLSEAAARLGEGYITDRADRFALTGSGAIYTTGMATDYSGQIAIYPDAAYIYNRYMGKRSINGYDAPAKYFIY